MEYFEFGGLNLKQGAQGDTVKKLQQALNENGGYALAVDGIFGGATNAALRDFQAKNGLDVDGIYGINTHNALFGIAPNKEFKYDDFSYDDYKESDVVNDAKNALDTHLSNKPGEYESKWQSQLDETINKILNREKFSYDLNGDALYQQYKDKYIQQGKMAMGDAIGQASAMTGGYGNSYAQSVGQQAYQAQLENLNDIVPELWQMAYDMYNQEGQDFYNQYAMLGDRENMDYGRYRDSVGDWQTERGYLADRYDTERDFDYGKYADDRNFSYGQYSDDRNLDYSEHRNAIADEQWQKDFDEARRKFNEQMAFNKEQYEYSKSQAASSGGSSNQGTSGSGNTTSSIPDSVREKAASFEDNESLSAWAYSLEDSGVIAEGQAAQLISEFYDHNEKYAEVYGPPAPGGGSGSTSISYESMVGSTKGWTVVSKGGGNITGIDQNAKVKAPNGETLTLGQLRNKLKDEGMSNSEATNAIKALQQNLGISSNWLFGW